MSDDLISRSALLEELNNFSMRITGSDNVAAITIMKETKKSIAKIIDEQPTAYDVDKVVEQLKKKAEDAKEYWGKHDDECAFEEMNAYGNAVKIIKSGGVKSGEWKGIRRMEELKKCPFCGGEAKIKGKVKGDVDFCVWCECKDCGARTTSYWPSIENEDLSLENIEMCQNRVVEKWNCRV